MTLNKKTQAHNLAATAIITLLMMLCSVPCGAESLEENSHSVFESVDLNSISVPPLKSIPKFNPLNTRNNNEMITKEIDRILN